MRHEDIHVSSARAGEGNLVVLYGALTGGDGIGVWCLASESFDETGPEQASCRAGG